MVSDGFDAELLSEDYGSLGDRPFDRKSKDEDIISTPREEHTQAQGP
jgi:hypothetical protein